MITEIISNAPLDTGFDSGWLQATLEKAQNFGRQAIASSIQLLWCGVTGSLDGIVEIQASNIPANGAIGAAYTVSSESNADDSELILLTGPLRFINIKYISNGTTGGRISVFIHYEEK